MAVYTVRIFKSWAARDPERRWSNVYEIQSASTSPGALDATIDTIVLAERQIHANQVNFLEATVSTWAADSHPYNPTTFYTRELSAVGTANPSPATWLDSNVCFLVKLGAGLGRSGRRFYRGCLTESDVETQGDGRWTLSAGSVMLQAGANFAAYRTQLSPMLSDGAGADKLVIASGHGATPTFVRQIFTLTSSGVVINKRNHRYFDKGHITI